MYLPRYENCHANSSIQREISPTPRTTNKFPIIRFSFESSSSHLFPGSRGLFPSSRLLEAIREYARERQARTCSLGQGSRTWRVRFEKWDMQSMRRAPRTISGQKFRRFSLSSLCAPIWRPNDKSLLFLSLFLPFFFFLLLLLLLFFLSLLL